MDSAVLHQETTDLPWMAPSPKAVDRPSAVDVLENIAAQKQAQLARGKNPTHVMLNKSTLAAL